MWRVAAKFVSKLLSAEQKEHRLQVARDVLDAANTDPEFLNTVITEGESWLYRYDPETKALSSQWKHPMFPRLKTTLQVWSKTKVMLTVFFDIHGIVHHEYKPKGQTVTKEYYQQVLKQLCDAIHCKRWDPWMAKNWQLHHENALAHSLHLIQNFLAKHEIPVVHQPPYSPDVVPYDFWLFPTLETPLKGSHFESRVEIMEDTKAEMNTILKEAYQECFQRIRIPILSGT